jgi:Glycosyl transferase family 2
MKIGVCLLTNEINYLEEWLHHHRNYGFDYFFVYFDGGIPENVTLYDDVTYNSWDCRNSPIQQMKCYEQCARVNKDYDYILFIDSDEYYMSNTGNVKQDVANLIKKYGNFQGLGIYWRMYGEPEPFFQERQPIENYTKWHANNHIKSLLDPKSTVLFKDPHKANLIPGRNYIDELGRKVIGPIGNHTSESIWIKHTWTRSKSEWETKVNRKGWYQFYNRKMEEFEDYNNKCTNVTHSNTSL